MPGGRKAKKAKHNRNISGPWGARIQCLNVHLFVLSRARIAVLLGFSLSRKTLLISHQYASMLETLIKGAGHECIFLPKFHCELNPIEMVSNHLLKLSLTNCAQADHFIQYWGWCKYRYREHLKANFAAAKERALQVLDVCPVTVEVIQRFINRSRRFVEAYRSGLTRKAAAWAVKKQKQHRVVSERAMVAMENINT